jgi:DNA modification methylase
MTYSIEVGDALSVLKDMPDGVFQCCATSPPYWGLRDYGVEGQLGLEKTPEEYVARMVEIFREVRRVLRDDGVLWLNLGDSYAGSSGSGGATPKQATNAGSFHNGGVRIAPGLKPKDLVGIPWMVAFALRADGWYLRSDVIWHKPNPMPESTRGRPTKSHEYCFLLAKSKDYFFDDEAIAEDAVGKNKHDLTGPGYAAPGQSPNTGSRGADDGQQPVEGAKRHVRSVWTISTVGYKEAHFAVMSPELARRMVASGSSERGACASCGAPWQRILKRTKAVIELSERAHEKREAGLATTCHSTMTSPPKMETLGWEPSCECRTSEGEPPDTMPCLVLDPFNGAGTTGLVAAQGGRDYVGIELNPEYAEIARRRIDAGLVDG